VRRRARARREKGSTASGIHRRAPSEGSLALDLAQPEVVKPRANLVGERYIAFGSKRAEESAEEHLGLPRRSTDLRRQRRARVETRGPRLVEQIERGSIRAAGFDLSGQVVEGRAAVAVRGALGGRHAVEDLADPAREEDGQ